jgi:hypothetical protein
MSFYAKTPQTYSKPAAVCQHFIPAHRSVLVIDRGKTMTGAAVQPTGGSESDQGHKASTPSTSKRPAMVIITTPASRSECRR